MPITAASVEANGWVLRVVLTGSPGSFASYGLSPEVAPRVVLTSSHAGFVKSGGIAVAGMLARTLVGTKPLRLPVNPLSPTTPVIDETDLGGGSIRVRIALSEFVHATDTGLLLSVLAGWRTGEAAAAGIAVTNNSTAVAPVPIFRWALAPFDKTMGSFRLSLMVASHHPQGFEPVAGVKFTVTDGSNVKTVWTTALGTDNTHGDNLRCYTAIIDPATATALNAGLLRCDAEVYPWLGTMRSTDAAGTRSMTGLLTQGRSAAAQVPWVIGYDPTGARYHSQYLFVDPAGTTTAAAAMVKTSHAAAKAVAPASRPATIQTAQQALYLQAMALVAANGQATVPRSANGAQIALAPGVVVPGTTAATSGVTANEVPAIICGDPDDANPRANCILQTAPGPVASRIGQFRIQNLTLELGGTSLFASGATTWFLDNIEMRARSGQSGSSIGWASSGPATDVWNTCATRVKRWKSNVTLSGAAARLQLARAVEDSRTLEALAVLRCRYMSAAEDSTGAQTVTGAWSGSTGIGSLEDNIIAFNDFRNTRGRFWTSQSLAAASAGTLLNSVRRQVILGNIVEKQGADGQPFLTLGEGVLQTMSYNIIEGNSFVGQRCNAFYSDPDPTTLLDCDTQFNQAFQNRVANNFFDWFPTKHDDFDSPTPKSVRTAAGVPNPTGYRPQMIEGWSHIYGVSHEANIDAGRTGGGNFPLEFYGLRSAVQANGTPGFSDDRSALGTGAGGGDYRPIAASVLGGRVNRGNSDRDLAGEIRRPSSAAGAYQSLPAVVVPTLGRSANLTGVSATLLALSLLPAPVLQGLAGAEAALTLALGLGPQRTEMRFSSLQAALETGGAMLLLPEDARLGFGDLPEPLLLPSGATGGARTLRVGVELRSITVQSN